MVYRITKSDGSTLISSLADYTQDTSTSLTLIGRGVENYGQIIANNLVHLLENFSSATASPPTGPLIGQLWYQNDKASLTYWDGAVWRAIATSDGLNNAKFISKLSLTGDAIGTSSNPSGGDASLAVSLASIGTAGTYVKVTTDTKGRVISGSALTPNDVTNALGYTPVQQGSGVGQNGNAIKIGLSNTNNSKLKATVDTLNDLGNFAFEKWVSDNFQAIGAATTPTPVPVATPTPTGATINFTPVQQGGGIGQLANKLNLGWSNAGTAAAPIGKLRLTVDGTQDQGYIATEVTAQNFANVAQAAAQNFALGSYNVPTVVAADPSVYHTQIAGGYQKLPSGMIIQSGSARTITGRGDVVIFPLAFPHSILGIVVSGAEGQVSALNPVNYSVQHTYVSAANTPIYSFQVYAVSQSGGSTGYAVNTFFDYIAFGF